MRTQQITVIIDSLVLGFKIKMIQNCISQEVRSIGSPTRWVVTPTDQATVNGSEGTPYTDGITNSATINGDMIWDVQMDAPNQLYYQCQTHDNMGGSIRILNNDSDFRYG